MLQLDLSWSLMDTIIAWILITIIWLTLNNSNWINNNNEDN